MKGKVSNTGYKKNSKDKNNDYNIIPTNRITMKDVDFPVLGISDKNDVRVMYPGEEHLFDGTSVLEYRMAKNGINQQDQKVDEQLKQLTDFSNNSLKVGGNIKKSNNMKSQILKIAGVKSEKEFYSKYPSEKAFMKIHGKEFKKAQTGAAINASQVHQPAFKPLSYQDQFDDVDKMLTGSTAAQRQELALKQQAASKDSGGGGFDIAGLMKLAGGAMQGGGMGDMGGAGAAAGASSVAAAARYGRDIPKAQNGTAAWYSQNPPGGATNYGQVQPANQLKSVGSTNPLATGGIGGFDISKLGPQGVGSMGGDTLSKIGGQVSQFAGPVGDVISGIGELKKEKEARKAAEAARDVSKVSLKAATSVDVDARRQQSENIAKQREAQMPVNTGEEFFPIYGVGTNVLARNGMMLQGGGEIQNTFAPNDIYMDSGYEPLNDSNVKQYYQGGRLHQMQDGGAANSQNYYNQIIGAGKSTGIISGGDAAGAAGGGTPWGAISSKATGIGQELMGGQNAGGKLGGTIGGGIGTAIGGPIGGAIGNFVGGLAGNALDTNAKKMKKAQDATQRNMQGMANANMAKGIQAQNQSFMKDGGWVSNDWTPQVIASFGGLDEQEVYDYAHEGMDTLRAGGHLRDYTPPSDRAMETYEDGGEIQSYGLGGELQTHWGGGAETISRNPYLPGTGETIMFRGKSHEEYSPNGETGIGVTYGGNPVEVERGEPMVELEEGGTIDPETGEVQKSGVVFGNLQIPNQYIDMLGDKNAKGKKFKNYVADLSKIEEKQNSIIDKSSKELNALDPINSFDKLKLTALQANIQGANMKLKDVADKKINAASLQNAINDTAEERGLVADDLARGKAKVDKEAQKQSAKFGGKFAQAQDGDWYANNSPAGSMDYGEQLSDWDQGELPELVIPAKRKPFGIPSGIFDVKGKIDSPTPDELIQDIKLAKKFKKDKHRASDEESEDKFDWMNMVNAILPTIRPSDAEDLDTAQLYPEMFAMATNQVAPVQAQTYQPDLGTPYDISYQDQLNANQADYRAAQRMMGYNPAAQANLNAQKYQANQSVLADQFRANQAMKDKVYGENRNMLNQAKLTNLGIFDKQYERQTEALANTKATTQAALNSISDKYAKNKLENRELKTYENMYNYRFGPNFRAQNMNPLAQFDTDYKGASAEELDAMSAYKKALAKREAAEEKKKKPSLAGESIAKRNGSIVKSYKNI